MPNNIKQILNELYLIDPELKQYEKTLEKLVTELLNTRPDTKFDPAFARELKQRVLAIGANEKAVGRFSDIFSRRFAFAFGSIALALVIVFVATEASRNLRPAGKVAVVNQRMSRLSMGAFGSLSSGGGSNAAATKGMGAESAPSVSRDMMSAPKAFGLGGGAASSMIYPYPVYNYKYVYKGDPIELKDPTLDVYKRIPPTPASADALLGMNFGLNLRSFSGSSLNSFEISQKNVKDGYAVYVNAADGQVSIYQNWETWDNGCKDGVCSTPEPLKMEQLPPDQNVIALADSFLSGHGISTQNYDKAEMDNQWRENLKMAASTAPGSEPDKLLPYVPDTLTVVYPLKINGQRVTENGGGIRGIRVGVDVRRNKVTSVWGVMSQDYQVAPYAAETSTDRIIKMAEQGGVYSYPVMYGEGANVTNVTVELGTPKRVLTAVWGQNGEVVAPALEFPIMNTGNTQIWQKSIIIPLIKDLLNVNENVDGGPVRMMKGVVAPTGVGSSEGNAGVQIAPSVEPILPN